MKRILILGSEGFIGANLVAYFIQLGWKVTGADVKPASGHYPFIKMNPVHADYNLVFQDREFDYLINAAGSGSVNNSNQNPVDDFRYNTLDTMLILEAIRINNPSCIYLHISSAAVYGNPDKLPIDEFAETRPVSPYGWHKLAAEKLCEEYASLFGIKVLIARPFSVYGPGLRKQLFWDIYRKWLSNPITLELSGSGKESRDFIFINDLVRCFHVMLEKGDYNAGIYNIASGSEIAIHDAVSSYLGHFSVMPELIFNNIQREGDPLNWRADVTRIRHLGFSNLVNFNSGIRETALWAVSQSI